jgi:hypothetical protein
MEEARRRAYSGSKTVQEEIEEEIRTTMPLEPSDILAIWNSVDTSKLPPELIQYIKRLNTAEKLAIVKAAMKGVVPDQLKKFAKVAKVEIVKRKVTKTVEDPTTVKAAYEKLIIEEIKKRALLSNQLIRAELIGFSEWWRPYDKSNAGKAFTKYRESSVELFADALSAFLVSPGQLAERAPHFWRGWTAYMERKPGVVSEYVELAAMLTGEGKLFAEHMREKIHGMFETGEEKILAAATSRQAAWRSVGESVRQFLEQRILDRTAPLKSKAAKLKNERAKRELDELFMADNPNHIFLDRLNEEVYQPLLAADGTKEDLGEYLFLRRVVNERGEIANPLGFEPESAQKQLDNLRDTLGPAKFRAVEQAARNFHEIVFERVEEAVDVGVYSRKKFDETIVPKKDNYAAFAVIKYLEDTISPAMKEQVGTFEEIANPFDSTVMKIYSLNRLIELNRAKNTLVDDVMKVGFANEITEVPIAHGDYEPRKKPAPGMDYLIRLVDGKPRAYLVAKNIADSFKHDDIGSLSKIMRLLRTATYGVFHPLYVVYSIGFQAVNIVRDIRRTHVNLGAKHGVSLGRVVYEYAKALPVGIRRARGIRDDLIQQMIEEKALAAPFSSFDYENSDTDTFQRMLAEHGLAEAKDWRSKLRRSQVAGAKQLGMFVDTVEGIGVVEETAAKVAGWRILTDLGVVGTERAYTLRKLVGTPDIQQRGLWTGLTNSILMYAKVRWNGLQADMSLAFGKETASAWWWRRLVWTIMPATLGWLAKQGMFGGGDDEEEGVYSKINQSDLENYDVIPLGTVAGKGRDDRVMYLTIPQDDTGRFLHKVWWHVLDTTFGKDKKKGAHQLYKSIEGELIPATVPVIDITSKWMQFAGGKNPYDDFYGREIVPRLEWEAGGWDASKKMLAWTVQKFGVLGDVAHWATGPVLGAPFKSGEEIPIETAIRGAPGLNRYLRMSREGSDNEHWAEIEAEDSERARFKLSLSPEVRGLTRKRYVLNRSKKRLSDKELEDRAIVNAWYNNLYLPATKAIRADEEAGESSDELRELLDEGTKEALSRLQDSP